MGDDRGNGLDRRRFVCAALSVPPTVYALLLGLGGEAAGAAVPGTGEPPPPVDLDAWLVRALYGGDDADERGRLVVILNRRGRDPRVAAGLRELADAVHQGLPAQRWPATVWRTLEPVLADLVAVSPRLRRTLGLPPPSPAVPFPCAPPYGGET